MSEWNPVSVEKALQECSNEIVSSVPKSTDAYAEYLRADRDYDLAFAKAYMAYQGPAHAKKYAAEIATSEERVARDAAEVAYRYFDKLGKALEKKLDFLRSVGVSVRQAYQEAGRGEW